LIVERKVVVAGVAGEHSCTRQEEEKMVAGSNNRPGAFANPLQYNRKINKLFHGVQQKHQQVDPYSKTEKSTSNNHPAASASHLHYNAKINTETHKHFEQDGTVMAHNQIRTNLLQLSPAFHSFPTK
jgi:hypothetical protein